MTRRVGVEISSTSVRIAALSTRGKRPRLVGFAEKNLPAGAVVDGSIVDREAVRRTIVLCMADGGFSSSFVSGPVKARVGIAGLRAIIREIEMIPVPPAELDEAVRLQALEIVPFPVEKTLLSARTLSTAAGETAVPGAPVRVLLAAAHRDLVEPVVDVVGAAGIVVEGVDLVSSALVRSLVDPSAGDGGAEAIVAVGAELTTVVIHEHGEPCFVRTIGVGGNAVTRAISAAMDMPLPDAENVKRRLAGSAGVASRVPPEAVAAAREGSASLLAEIRSSIEYYSNLEGRGDVRRVVLTGGGAQLSGFLERLQHQTSATVVAGDWLARVDEGRVEVDRDRLESSGAVVAGLALPEPNGRKVLDLVPPETLVRRRQHRVERRFVAAAVVVLLALVGGGTMRYLQVRRAQSNVGSLEGTIALLQRQIPRYDKVAHQNAVIAADEHLGQPLVSHEVNWPGVLSALVKYTPSGIGASGFSGTVSVPAVATTSTTSSSTGASAPAAGSSALPAPSSTVATVNLAFTGSSYPAFQRWFNAMLASGRFEIEQYSGITSGGGSSGGPRAAATSSSVAYTAQLGVTGRIHTSRLGQFEVKVP